MKIVKRFVVAFCLMSSLVPCVGCGPSFMSEEEAQKQAGNEEDKDDPNDGAKPE